MKVAIFANGEMCSESFARTVLSNCDYVVACDGGLKYCHRLYVKPNCIVGDIDSADKSLLNKYQDVPVSRFPSEKDQTDLELAIAYACDIGATSIIVLGGLGKRFDHQLANAHVLAQALKRGVIAQLRDQFTCVQLINSHCQLHKSDGSLVSLLPLTTTVDGIVTEGLQYPLRDESLSVGFARGVSNLITKELARVSLKNGMLLVVQTKE